MQAEFWHERWENNQIGFHQVDTNTHLQTYWSALGVTAGAAVFVPLCGKSRDMLWLRAQGFRVFGVELSERAVRDFFQENNLIPSVSKQGAFDRWESDGVVLWVGDFFELTPDMLVECGAVFDRAALIALPLEMRARYAVHLRRVVPQGVGSLLITVDYDQPQMAGPPFAVSDAEVHQLFDGEFEVTRLTRVDALDDSPSFRQRGLTRLDESVFVLVAR